jgi:GntR family transcriptional regulator
VSAAKKPSSKKATHAYLKIEAHLNALIGNGSGRTEPLPTEPDLATEFGVSRMTVRQAYQRLVSAGKVVRHRGLGSFVTGHVVEEMPIDGAPDFQSWIVRGETGTGRRVLERALVRAPAIVAKAFGLKRGSKVTYIQLLRFKNGVPCLDARYVPASLHGSLTRERLERTSLLQSMAEAGYEVAAGQVEIDAHRASRGEAAMLGIKFGEPVLERRVAFSDPKGNCIVFGDSRYPSGNAYTFRIDFHQVRDAAHLKVDLHPRVRRRARAD